ncbi:hypothetical protein EDC94DRAFT_617488 [Helicostylum pulchrum]|nr:hypothetical protein EDC94DRAFT_617488 [Helicostylum pulchrum]
MIKPISRYELFIIFLQSMLKLFMYSCSLGTLALLGLLLFWYFLLYLKFFGLLGSLSGASNIFIAFGVNWCGYISS